MTIHELAFAKQTAQGTAATAAAYKIPLVGGTVRPRRDINVLEETGDSRLRDIAYVSQVGVEGSPEYAIRPAALGLLLYGVLGAQAVDGVEDPYEHTFVEADEQPWLTFWRRMHLDGTTYLYEKFIDCRIAQMVLTSEAGQPIRAGMTIMGLDPRSITSVTYAAEVDIDQESGAPFMHYDGKGALVIDGSPVSSIERAVTTINNNSTFQQGDAVTGYDAAEGMLSVQIETTQKILDAALYNEFHYGSASPTTLAQASPNVIELTAGVSFLWTRVPAAPGPERSLRIQGSRLQIQSVEGFEPNTGNDPMKRASTYALLRPESGAGITATLKNAVAAY
jgi:hypothetical protein